MKQNRREQKLFASKVKQKSFMNNCNDVIQDQDELFTEMLTCTQDMEASSFFG